MGEKMLGAIDDAGVTSAEVGGVEARSRLDEVLAEKLFPDDEGDECMAQYMGEHSSVVTKILKNKWRIS